MKIYKFLKAGKGHSHSNRIKTDEETNVDIQYVFAVCSDWVVSFYIIDNQLKQKK